MIQSIGEDVLRLYANTVPFCMRELSIPGLRYGGWCAGTDPTPIPKDDCITQVSVSPF